ncbi:hypothetical protein Pyn_28943 [Prunus yedoensis var. nudiflora]|uniref:Uncharacterized protein n=1 Tax=Prunus yedoensis var. nudiflora TaxID=2094558 RepID=A0A314ZA08_PRUYE|nr:hypothetical protein Pyn_28943 [Prunus yedoensis var. nudiflora]
MRFRCKIDDMGGRDGPKLRRLGFLARRAYEPSSSPLVFASRGSPRNLHEIFESVASKKFVHTNRRRRP